jgi:hypothetical protein
MNGRSSSQTTRRIARGAIVGVAAVGIVGLAAVGAVLALGVLAVGAVAHAALRLTRRSSARAAATSDVIDGEFRVIREPANDASVRLRRLPQV